MNNEPAAQPASQRQLTDRVTDWLAGWMASLGNVPLILHISLTHSLILSYNYNYYFFFCFFSTPLLAFVQKKKLKKKINTLTLATTALAWPTGRLVGRSVGQPRTCKTNREIK